MNVKKVFLSSMLIVVLAFYSVSFASDTSNVVIKLTIGNPEMTVNGQTAEIDPGRNTSPVILENRTLVPVRSYRMLHALHQLQFPQDLGKE